MGTNGHNGGNSNNNNGLGNETLKKSLQQEIQSVTFDSTASIDTKGIISLQSKVRNRASFDKHKIHTVLRVLNEEDLVYILDSGWQTLYGTVAGMFIPSKKSSTVINKYGNLSFEDLSVADFDAYHTDTGVLAKDREIAEVAAKIRRLKVLTDAEGGDTDLGNQLSDLVDQMTKAKDDRARRLSELEHSNKFKALSLDICHEVT
ncbi:hypothetical protein HDV00_001528 [Rhizophlyctis rosea]|nr:hypothetical protein HDV00_001528 [Rhizophlyctis rosea]